MRPPSAAHPHAPTKQKHKKEKWERKISFEIEKTKKKRRKEEMVNWQDGPAVTTASAPNAWHGAICALRANLLRSAHSTVCLLLLLFLNKWIRISPHSAWETSTRRSEKVFVDSHFIVTISSGRRLNTFTTHTDTQTHTTALPYITSTGGER